MDPLFDRDRIEQVVAALSDRLNGDWLLIGGALVALWLEPRRTTEDIDVIPVGGGAERLALLSAAVELGLPVEAVNSAADFFVAQIPDWRSQIELFRTGARGRLYRPSPTLFLLLKARRLSAQDLADCRSAIARARADGAGIDTQRLLAWLDAAPPGDAELEERRAALREELQG